MVRLVSEYVFVVCVIYRGGNLVADEYFVTPRMSTYLLAFIVCQFERTNVTTKNGIKVIFYYSDYFMWIDLKKQRQW